MKRIIVFTILVLSLGWLGLGLDLMMKNDFSEGLGSLLFILAPALLALVLSIREKQIKSLGCKLNLKQNWKWYMFCLFFDVVVFSFVFFIGFVGKGMEETPAIGVIIRAALLSIPTAFIKNIFEEIGWRGYLSERLYDLMNHRLANIAVGLIWATWHLPYWLMIIPREIFIGYSPYKTIWFIILMNYIALINLSFLYNRLKFATKSVWPPVMIHTMNNVIVASLFANITYTEQTKWFFSPGVNGVLYLVLLFSVNIYLEKKDRIKSLRAL